jgi:hypothetical protein
LKNENPLTKQLIVLIKWSANILDVVDCPTSASIWSTLEHALTSSSNSWIMQLHGSFQYLRQEDDTVTIYLQKAKSLFDKLAAVIRPISLY